ncbi:MAG: thioredoxin family protein [Planctomycetota bacterium]
MMRMWTAALSACVLMGSIAQASVSDDLWVADYDEAMRIAKESGKDVLVDFTGSDWCIWCKRLDGEVFSQEYFKTEAPKDYVLCALDFPNDPAIQAKVPNPERNAEIRDKFEIRGYPTILVLTNEGEVVAETGYREGGPNSYVEHLRDISAKGHAAIRKVAEIVAAYERAAEGDARTAALKNVVAAYAEMWEAAPARKLQPLVTKAYEMDADGTLGMRKPALGALLRSGAGDEAMATEAEKIDAENAEGLFELAVIFHFGQVRDDESASAAIDTLEDLLLCDAIHDTEQIAQLCAQAAMWCAEPKLLDDAPRAQKLAAKALELGIDDERTRKMLESIVASGEGAEG